MKSIIFVLAAFMFKAAFCADSFPKLPPNAAVNFPILQQHLANKWGDYEYPWFIAGQVEQETCISLKHSKCWSNKAELKTSREYGFGLGQLTIAYDKNGKERFNAFNDVRTLDVGLKNWRFEDRYDANRQLLAVVVRDKFEYSKVKGSYDSLEHSAFFFNSYNGGQGGMLKDRRLCASTKGCDSSKWFGHVETTSYKSKIAVKGYSKSFFEISREYPRNIIYVRSPRYKPYFTSQQQKETPDGKSTPEN